MRDKRKPPKVVEALADEGPVVPGELFGDLEDESAFESSVRFHKTESGDVAVEAVSCAGEESGVIGVESLAEVLVRETELAHLDEQWVSNVASNLGVNAARTTVGDLVSRGVEEYVERELDDDARDKFAAAVETVRPLLETRPRVLVIGSYEKPSKWKLEFVRHVLDELSEDECELFLLSDVPGVEEWVNPEVKFRLLADVADCIVLVAEHDRGGALLEQGVISVTESYRKKSFVLKREFASEEARQRNFTIRWNGVFDKLDHDGQLLEWESLGELCQCCRKIHACLERANAAPTNDL